MYSSHINGFLFVLYCSIDFFLLSLLVFNCFAPIDCLYFFLSACFFCRFARVVRMPGTRLFWLLASLASVLHSFPTEKSRLAVVISVYGWTMDFILDGCSIHYAHIRSKSDISIGWRHLVTSKEVSNSKKKHWKKKLFYTISAQHILSNHLIEVQCHWHSWGPLCSSKRG